jgi:methylated-DNA-[protein]-cysteine S-methyltransferase
MIKADSLKAGNITRPATTHFYQTMESPLGTLKLIASDRGLVAVLWDNEDPEQSDVGGLKKVNGHPLLDEAERQLKEYFAGKRKQFSLRLDWRGTEFQKKVWAALVEIPFGETRSYADIARQIGNPKAVRAVGAANGKNPLPIIAPCHRVIGSNGKLVGFGGGLATKALLLKLESKGRELSALDSSHGTGT